MTHDDIMDSAAAYALDALDPDEQRSFEAHLRGCDICREEVESYRSVVMQLPHMAPAASMSPSQRDALRQRILREAQATRGSPTVDIGTAREKRSAVAPARTSFPPWIAAAAAIIVAVVGALSYSTMSSERSRLASQLADARTEVALKDSIADALAGPEVHVVSLVSSSQAKPSARVFWNHTKHVFVVASHSLSPSPEGKTYQLWAMPGAGARPISMGTFTVQAGQETLAVLAVPQDVVEAGLVEQCALTVEPVGGSEQPTETPRLLGSWRHVD
jgi:anti-sigma-K factor RskA